MALLLLPTGAAVLTFTTTANSLIQLGSAPEVRGRVMALYVLVFLGGTPVGAPLIGALAEAFGPRSGIVVGGLVTAASGLVAAFVMTRVRSLRVEAHVLRRRPHLHVRPGQPRARRIPAGTVHSVAVPAPNTPATPNA
jgi:MFS family permease